MGRRHCLGTGHTGPGDGESSPGGGRSILQGPWGGSFVQKPGTPARVGWGVQPRGWSEYPFGPMGRQLCLRTGHTGLGGTGSPAQGVVGVSLWAHGEAASSKHRAHRPWGGRGVQPKGVFGASCQANVGPSSSENRAHRPGGDGESCPGGVRSLLPGQWGAIFFREPGAPARGGRGSCPGGVRSLLPGQWGAIFFIEPGAPARGGRGVLPRGCSEPPARPMGGHLLQRTGRTGPGGTGSPAQGVFGVSRQANGGPSSSENRAHRPGGDGESCPGGVRSLLPGQWGAIFFREPGAPARGGRGVLPRGCSESPARPMGGHLLQRTGRTGPGGTGSPAQGVFGASCQANGGPSSS